MKEASRSALRILAGGQAGNVGQVKTRLREIAAALRTIGMQQLADELESLASMAWQNADALYTTILSILAEKR